MTLVAHIGGQSTAITMSSAMDNTTTVQTTQSNMTEYPTTYLVMNSTTDILTTPNQTTSPPITTTVLIPSTDADGTTEYETKGITATPSNGDIVTTDIMMTNGAVPGGMYTK